MLPVVLCSLAKIVSAIPSPAAGFLGDLKGLKWYYFCVIARGHIVVHLFFFSNPLMEVSTVNYKELE